MGAINAHHGQQLLVVIQDQGGLVGTIDVLGMPSITPILRLSSLRSYYDYYSHGHKATGR